MRQILLNELKQILYLHLIDQVLFIKNQYIYDFITFV